MTPAPVESRFDTYQGYRLALMELVALAQTRIVVFDPDLSETQLESPQGAAALARFLAARRATQLHVVLHRPDHVERHCPRLLALLRHHAHAIDMRRTPHDLRQITDCFALADGRHGVIRFHADHPRRKLLLNCEHEVADWQRRFEELRDLSTPTLAPTTLGL